MITRTIIAIVAVVMVTSSIARSEEMTECRIGGAPPITVTRHRCDMLTIQADAMRDILTNAPADYPMIPIMNSCIKGLTANLPGYDYNTYFNTCGWIVAALRMAPH